MEESKWGQGIPDNYAQSDILDQEDLLGMAIDHVEMMEIENNGYELVASNYDINAIPNLVYRKGDRYQMIAVLCALAPRIPALDDELHGIMLGQAKKFDARVYYAPVSIGSRDRARFEAGLALKDDSFYVRYEGLKKILPIQF